MRTKKKLGQQIIIGEHHPHVEPKQYENFSKHQNFYNESNEDEMLPAGQLVIFFPSPKFLLIIIPLFKLLQTTFSTHFYPSSILTSLWRIHLNYLAVVNHTNSCLSLHDANHRGRRKPLFSKEASWSFLCRAKFIQHQYVCTYHCLGITPKNYPLTNNL